MTEEEKRQLLAEFAHISILLAAHSDSILGHEQLIVKLQVENAQLKAELNELRLEVNSNSRAIRDLQYYHN